MQPQKVKPRKITNITILVKRLICIALILTNKAILPLFQIREQSRANLENKTKLTDTKTLNLADIESATTKYAIHSSNSAELSFMGNGVKSTVQ